MAWIVLSLFGAVQTGEGGQRFLIKVAGAAEISPVAGNRGQGQQRFGALPGSPVPETG